MPKSMIPRPCLECGRLTDGQTRCGVHQAQLEAKKNAFRYAMRSEKKKALYGGEYQRRAKIVRQNALFCHLCLKPAIPGDPWEADHVDATNPDSELLPAHKSCNGRRGNLTISQYRERYGGPGITWG